MCHEKLYQTDATSQTEEEEEVRQAEDEEEEEEQDINQNYLGEESDDYIDITDSEELEEQKMKGTNSGSDINGVVFLQSLSDSFKHMLDPLGSSACFMLNYVRTVIVLFQ